MKYEILTLRLPPGSTEALAAAGKPHGMDARAYGRWRLLRALAEDTPVMSAPFLIANGEPPPAPAPAAAPTGPQAVPPAKTVPTQATGPRPVTDTDARPSNCWGPCSWITPAIGDTVIRCHGCSKELSLLRIQDRHMVGMIRVQERNGNEGFRGALIKAVTKAKGDARRKVPNVEWIEEQLAQ